ncbi:MAG TPA: response regulator [Allosphingosinicella sp.]|nr:response regulator [Allosphingosinicella sp.]
MTDETAPSADLSGTKILVIEDEFYLAMDIKEALERAGGQVRGPFADAGDGLAELERERPDCAIVDINLGNGPSFEIAEELQRWGVPFLFLTGYDAPAIPPGLADIERLEKPADSGTVVEAVARLTSVGEASGGLPA